MRKIVGIILCLWIATASFAYDYTESAASSSFSSTSAYRASAVAPSSFSAISAANFAALNSEGGACYQDRALSGPRKGRPGGGATGQGKLESPVGDIPWVLLLVAALAYAVSLRLRKRNLDNAIQ